MRSDCIQHCHIRTFYKLELLAVLHDDVMGLMHSKRDPSQSNDDTSQQRRVVPDINPGEIDELKQVTSFCDG